MIIVDYNVGNIGSIVNMFKKIGVKARLSSDKSEILAADKLLLPGVGSFDHGMKSLYQSGLIDVLNRKVLEDKTPILGICLGMQLLLSGSDEGSEPGLGWIKGRVKRFDFSKLPEKLKIPHMGWNVVYPKNNQCLFKYFDEEARFYFVHSYYVECEDSRDSLATTLYGDIFTSAVGRENVYGAQFHPEKSHRFGMQLLKNFVELT